MKKPVLSPEKLREAAMSGRRSALYRWMLENFDQFSGTVAEAGRPNWQALAVAFGEGGLRDRLGKAPSAEGTRQTWFLVRQAVAKTPKLVAKPAAMVPGPSRPVTASGERQPALLPSAAPDERTVDLDRDAASAAQAAGTSLSASPALKARHQRMTAANCRDPFTPIAK